jgi:hypothetical protein
MIKKLTTLLRLADNATEDQILAGVEALLKENDRLKSAAEQRSADEKEIAARMSRGLSRAQAISVIERQRQFDADKAKAKEAAAKEPKPKTDK